MKEVGFKKKFMRLGECWRRSRSGILMLAVGKGDPLPTEVDSFEAPGSQCLRTTRQPL